jgi:hypothetical protein
VRGLSSSVAASEVGGRGHRSVSKLLSSPTAAHSDAVKCCNINVLNDYAIPKRSETTSFQVALVKTHFEIMSKFPSDLYLSLLNSTQRRKEERKARKHWLSRGLF